MKQTTQYIMPPIPSQQNKHMGAPTQSMQQPNIQRHSTQSRSMVDALAPIRVSFHVGHSTTIFYWKCRCHQVEFKFPPEFGGRAACIATYP